MVRRRNRLASVTIGFGIVAIAVLNIIPLAWGVLASLKPVAQLVTYPPTLFDFNATTENYRSVVEGGFMTGVRNSALYGLASIALALATGSLAAYGFERFTFRGKEGMFLLVIAGIPLAIGSAAILVPKYLFFSALGLTNHWYTLPLIYGVHSLPITIWTLKGALEGVPRELDEAAYVDGASSLTILCPRWIMKTVPLSRPTA